MLLSKPTIRLLKSNCFKLFVSTANRISLVSTLSVPNVKEKKSHKMKAWQIHSYGNIQELQLTSARYPYMSKPSNVLVQVHAASVNPIDIAMLGGYGKTVLNLLRNCDVEFPLTLGRDFSGVVIDKGHGVGNEFKIGDEVYGVVPVHKQGSHAELVVAEAQHILHKPTHLTPIEAGSIFYTAMTAWSALFVTGDLLIKDSYKPKVLILGASGGVGTMAVQILKSQNATVIGTCSADAVPLVRSLGADNIFDYRDPNYISNVASEGKFDIILDCAQFGHQNVPSTWQFKTYITLNSPLLHNTDKLGLIGGSIASLGDLINSNIRKCPEAKSVRWAYFMPLPNGLRFINKLIINKQITPSIQKVFTFQNAPQAYEALANGHSRGKIVIDMKSG